jgi:hypothetical protein
MHQRYNQTARLNDCVAASNFTEAPVEQVTDPDMNPFAGA